MSATKGRGLGTILFAVHAANRTGPPIALLHFLRWLRAETDVRFEVLLWQGGPLAEEFSRLAPVHDVDLLRASPLVRLLERLRLHPLGRLVWETRLRFRLCRVPGLAMVFVNCVGSRHVLAYLWPRRPRVVTFVHELDLQFHHLDADGGRLRTTTDHFIACAEVVRDRLVRHGIEAERVSTHYEFIAVDEPNGSAPPGTVSRQLGIPDEAMVVGACGVLEWRKAPDLFVQLAAGVNRGDPPIPVHFVWIGGSEDVAYEERLRAEAAAADLEDRVHFVGTQADLVPWFELFDVFVLTSREDAFPLVCLQAAAFHTPIVCFDTGGIPEFVAPGCGFVAEYPDVEAMTGHVLELLSDPAARQRRGDAAAARVERDHTVEVGAPRLLEELNRRARS